MAVFWGLKAFFQSQQGIDIHLFVDNKTTVVYLNKRGDSFQDSITSEHSYMVLVHREGYLYDSNLCSRETEHCYRQSIMLVASEHQIVSQSLNIKATSGPSQLDLFASAQNHKVHHSVLGCQTKRKWMHSAFHSKHWI